MLKNETIGECYARLCDTSNQTFSFGKQYSNSKLVRKVLRSLLERFAIKVIAIDEAKDSDNMKINELIGSLQTFKISLDELRRCTSKGEKSIALQVRGVIPIKGTTTTRTARVYNFVDSEF